MKKLLELFFGVRCEGEPINEPEPKPIRDLITEEYNEWCREFRVSSKCSKQPYYWF
jgi:hypothetical protein